MFGLRASGGGKGEPLHLLLNSGSKEAQMGYLGTANKLLWRSILAFGGVIGEYASVFRETCSGLATSMLFIFLGQLVQKPDRRYVFFSCVSQAFFETTITWGEITVLSPKR